MLLNFVFCIAGCGILALVNVATFLYGLGFDTRSMTGGVPFWLLLLGAAVLPLLACARTAINITAISQLSEAGTAAWAGEIGGGVSLRIAPIRLTCVLPWNAFFPASIS